MAQDNDTNKPMTLDRLARMVADGLDEVKEDIKGLATKADISGIGQRMGKVEFKIDEMHEILTRFEEGDIMDLQKRIKILERAVKAMSKQL